MTADTSSFLDWVTWVFQSNASGIDLIKWALNQGPLAQITVITVLALATYVAILYFLRLPLGFLGYVVGCSATFILLMAWWGVFTHWLVYDIGWWTILPLVPAFFFVYWLIDRRDHRLGRLPEPRTRFDRWYQATMLPPVEKSFPRSGPEQARQLPPSSEH